MRVTFQRLTANVDFNDDVFFNDVNVNICDDVIHLTKENPPVMEDGQKGSECWGYGQLASSAGQWAAPSDPEA